MQVDAINPPGFDPWIYYMAALRWLNQQAQGDGTAGGDPDEERRRKARQATPGPLNVDAERAGVPKVTAGGGGSGGDNGNDGGGTGGFTGPDPLSVYIPDDAKRAAPTNPTPNGVVSDSLQTQALAAGFGSMRGGYTLAKAGLTPVLGIPAGDEPQFVERFLQASYTDVEASVTVLGDPSSPVGVAVRIQDGTPFSGYVGWTTGASGGYTFELWEVISNGISNTWTIGLAMFSPGDRITLRVVGTLFSLYQNGTLIGTQNVPGALASGYVAMVSNDTDITLTDFLATAL